MMRWRQRLRSERGFTLIELLVAMVGGIVVLLAALTILDVSIHQTTRTFSLVDATSRAEPALETLENELHSACFADNETPIQSGSSGTSLIFVSSVGNAATPTPTWHEIDFSGGDLTDNSYAASEQEVNGTPTWARGSLENSRIVLTNVGQATNTSTNTQIPPFQYFAYQQAPGTDAAGNNYMILPDGTSPIPGTSTTVYNPLITGSQTLSSTQAATAAEVLITMVVGPAGGNNENTNLNGVNDTVTDGVTLRLTPAANNTAYGGDFSPCQ
ncbi:MAG TPA: prepilin-type N-terminal cleavage/methylation domain-containing protein [Solirubrobacteraceae bacterium]|nr:prepilin-type N-terminal cleavage/methylation domain-containing protein [Solirubrobacteraceae bacterium]